MKKYLKFIIIDTQGYAHDNMDKQVIIGNINSYIETQLNLLVDEIANKGGLYIDTSGYPSAVRVDEIRTTLVD